MGLPTLPQTQAVFPGPTQHLGGSSLVSSDSSWGGAFALPLPAPYLTASPCLAQGVSFGHLAYAALASANRVLLTAFGQQAHWSASLSPHPFMDLLLAPLSSHTTPVSASLFVPNFAICLQHCAGDGCPPSSPRAGIPVICSLPSVAILTAALLLPFIHVCGLLFTWLSCLSYVPVIARWGMCNKT